MAAKEDSRRQKRMWVAVYEDKMAFWKKKKSKMNGKRPTGYFEMNGAPLCFFCVSSVFLLCFCDFQWKMQNSVTFNGTGDDRPTILPFFPLAFY